MIVAAAVCPHPPLLVPGLAVGASAELDAVRRACDRAVGWLAGEAETIVLVGGDDGGRWVGFRPWGAEVPGFRPPEPLPLSLLVGYWLLDRAGVTRPVESLLVPDGAGAAACAASGRRLAGDPRRLGLLVSGDGSRCRGLAAPGYDDPRAAPYDEAVARALAEVDAGALLALDEDASTELGVAGRAAWQVLAGAVADGPTAGWVGALHHHTAPYGVAYLVATWRRAGSAT